MNDNTTPTAAIAVHLNDAAEALLGASGALTAAQLAILELGDEFDEDRRRRIVRRANEVRAALPLVMSLAGRQWDGARGEWTPPPIGATR